jgi:CubicO group peptidase (beta-lactamase class C family)
MKIVSVDKLMRSGYADGVFPGAVLLAARDGEIVFHSAYGWADIFSLRKMTVDTPFDLASLTKPLATALAAMYLVQYRGLDLDRPCKDYCPPLAGSDKAGITIRQLLSHRSGMVAWRPYYMRLRHMPRIARLSLLRQWLLTERLRSRPDLQSEYSDAGFLLLQWILEYYLNQSLAVFISDTIYAPLGVKDLYFAALQSRPMKPAAATELCPWRSRLLSGEVHDDNAAVLGGAAGHAGLFGTAHAAYLLLQGLLDADTGHRRHVLFDAELVRLFFERRKGTQWALGFDTPSPSGSSAGQHFSRRSVGHLGYTGTSFWMDRQKGVIVIFLTNRVHPSRYNDRIKKFRPRLHDVVMTALRKK